MPYTLENLPQELDDALRSRAEKEGKSVSEVVVDALKVTFGLPAKRRDLSDIAGTWVEDPEVDAALRDQDRIDPEMWR